MELYTKQVSSLLVSVCCGVPLSCKYHTKPSPPCPLLPPGFWPSAHLHGQDTFIPLSRGRQKGRAHGVHAANQGHPSERGRWLFVSTRRHGMLSFMLNQTVALLCWLRGLEPSRCVCLLCSTAKPQSKEPDGSLTFFHLFINKCFFF